MEKTTKIMLKQENLAANFCGLLTRRYNYRKSAVEWRILGQEQDGSMLASWISLAVNDTPIERSHIGVYNAVEKTFRILHSFDKRENCVQASVNNSNTVLAYVLKEPRTKSTANETESVSDFIYVPFIVEVKPDNDAPSKCTQTCLLPDGSSKQVMTQFLWQKQSIFKKTYEDKLLLFIHDDCITMLTTKLAKTTDDQISLNNVDTWRLDAEAIGREVIVKHFIWAQWDPITQALYYIHLKPTVKSSLEKDDDKTKENAMATTTTLSAHQFHENLPRETVVRLKCEFSYDSVQIQLLCNNFEFFFLFFIAIYFSFLMIFSYFEIENVFFFLIFS